mgnify:CR=1 FL=1
MCKKYRWYFSVFSGMFFARRNGRDCGHGQPRTEISMPDLFSPFTLKGVTLRKKQKDARKKNLLNRDAAQVAVEKVCPEVCT